MPEHTVISKQGSKRAICTSIQSHRLSGFIFVTCSGLLLTVAALLIAVAQSVVTENFKLSPVRGVVLG